MDKAYNFKDTEPKIYKSWADSGFFSPEANPPRADNPNPEVFSIVLPPPNVTGTLHMGHAAMLAVEDILVRYHRMKGDKTLWLPGTDHAAIATQEKVEKELYKREKKTRHDLGREVFLERVNQFAKESHDTIVGQIEAMGASLDWSREAFTLDQKRELAVRTAFKRMYEAGLIYRGDRIVSWDPKMQTTVSDDEVDWIEEKAPFYYFKYGPFEIGTARPETKFGDKYVVMHPNDERYKKYNHGDQIEVEWINGKIKATIIKDEAIDMEFGTGVMTITPAHSLADFEIAQRHNLEKEQIIDTRGLLLPIAGELAGEHIKKARPKIVEKLKERGLLVKVDENYIHRVAINSRGNGMIEPQILKQWFIDVNKSFTMPVPLTGQGIPGLEPGQETTLKELMKKAVENGGVKIIPENFERIYYHWIDNLRDWCISRQIWYGHQIPVWYRPKADPPEADTEEIYVGTEAPIGDGWTQDPDTLDTWFSSGLWTFSTLGWPEETEDLRTYHPTNLLETGYDILFFWIARMVLMTGFLLGEVPFKTVYLHGLVRAADGKKMSKSLNNGIDPLEMAQKYGADATRMSLIIGAAPGADIRLSEDKIKGYKHFANKIWNATRFVLMNIEDYQPNSAELIEQDAKTFAEFEAVKKEITRDIEEYRLHLAGEKAYHYFWHTFADVVIEASKKNISEGSAQEKQSAQKLLIDILSGCLKMLHPFMPFVTEEVWGLLPNQESSELLMVQSWD
ncbi:MAG: valine--tRNA ligase [Candidatus Harrisonbacteria bacterium CG10_big_fil_rev_8_21_14_0_10_45_28]|uniref:valine--tRNA ligase n=1 Tax=Candidatus Harrisonbacteria bacterium CG10_big_fil_rev_8_21_14_0_10_45_28 TaxID=1974586 RepID=A0A2H0UQ41_9BACT|nr:MAG: valine--tRNA ligase [Candidatus Harrisonbacteria bacterium CG10_big_fil_rev_8_21_14_0_10_45_28]